MRRWTLKVWGTAIPAQITEIIFRSGGRFAPGPRLPMPSTFDALRIVSLGSAVAWWAVGIVPAIRTRLASRLERALAATAFFLGGWAFLDAVYPALAGVSSSPDVVFIGLRATLITFATLTLLLMTKWMARGPSRYDALLVLPIIGSLGLVWTELPSRAGSPSWGYSLWASQQLIYVGASIVLSASLFRGRTDPKAGFRRRSFWTVGILVVAVAASLSAKLHATPTSALYPPLASPSLIIRAGLLLVVILPLSRGGLSKGVHGAAAVQG